MIAPVDRYTCEQVFQLLDEYLDRELAPDEIKRVEEHLATCAACASEYAFEGTLLDGLKEKLRRIDVPRSALAKVQSALTTRRPGPPADVDGHGET